MATNNTEENTENVSHEATLFAEPIFHIGGFNVFGILSIGIWKTFNKYVNLKALGGIFKKIRHEPTVIIVAPITFFVGLIEIIGEFAKMASLSFRLFGNVFAGEVLLVSMAALVAYIVPIPFLFLELLVGVIQALIFSILLVVYFTISASHHDEEYEPARHADASHAGGEHDSHQNINKPARPNGRSGGESIIISSNT